MSIQLPSHQSERMFRKYEKVIRELMQNYPNASTFDPTPFSPNTYACRLRDAMTSVLKHRWNTSIDLKKLAEIREQIKVCIHDCTVVVCLASERPAEAIAPVEIETEGAVINVVEPQEVHLHAICILLNDKKVAGPFRLTKVKLADVKPILDRHQVGFYEDGDSIIII